MKKRDFKALVLMGIASGAMICTASVEAHETSTNLESTFAGRGGACGGGGGCGGAPTPMIQNNGNRSGCNGQPNRPTNNQPQQSNYTQTQKNSRWSRQIAEGEETMPTNPTNPNDDQYVQPNGARRAPNACNGGSGCKGKTAPSQYRTRS